ncbi:MAG TPA: type II toxin-antitoxin system VapC family toxin [Pseudonocardiaceae bacterium]|nr:type II toxin-antitoxin system VapC family toxin [Pseudonocardiaceae bacterium]
MSYLLDTNVLSEWRKASPDAGVAEWLAAAVADELFVSVITISEIRRGIAKLQSRNDHRQAAAYRSWLAVTKDLFVERIVPIDVGVAEEWGQIAAARPVSMADGLIAATAKVRGWTVVTRNIKDFDATGVRLLNPFTG